MLISKEDALKIAEISYMLFEKKEIKTYMSYKKAMELDVNTGAKILEDIVNIADILEVKEAAAAFGGTAVIADKEIVIVDNYQYVDRIEYEHDKPNTPVETISNLVVYFVDGGSIEVNINDYSICYAPNIYGPVLEKYEPGHSVYPQIKDIRTMILYFKMLIAEDRLVNPYLCKQTLRNMFTREPYFFPMKEAMNNYDGLEAEIDLLNEMLKHTKGYLFAPNITSDYKQIHLKSTILFLESKDPDLALRFRRYDNEDGLQKLNIILEAAFNGFDGIVFTGNNKLTLI